MSRLILGTSRHAKLGVGADASPKLPTPHPLKSAPTIVTKADIFDYGDLLQPMIKGLNADLLANTTYADPDQLFAEEKDLLEQAQSWDKCPDGYSCPGWKPSDPEPSGINIPAQKARELRQKANAKRAERRLMEDRADERKLSNAQIKNEVLLWSNWQDFLTSYKNFLASAEKATLVKSSDFEQMQSFDLQLQTFRNRYQLATGKAPSTPLTPTAPDSGFPWGTVLFLATVVAGVMVIREVRGFAMLGRAAAA